MSETENAQDHVSTTTGFRKCSVLVCSKNERITQREYVFYKCLIKEGGGEER